jgi:hypothetical protein
MCTFFCTIFTLLPPFKFQGRKKPASQVISRSNSPLFRRGLGF